jgi:serine/threonine protein kinase
MYVGQKAGDNVLKDKDGKEFRCFRGIKKLGRGTFADVYQGEWINPPDNIPIKVAIKEFYLNKQTLRRALETEITIMQTLDHPNIVKLVSVIAIEKKVDDSYDSFVGDNVDEDKLWVILEFCEGGDFKTFLKDTKNSPKQQRLSEKWARIYMKQIAEGLRYLRSKNIIHRDLKPHNLLMTKDHKTIKIADFGFARILGSEALEATVCGSPLYMAPEVLRGEEYNSKADLWSVGVILYEMLCGVRPFQNVNDIYTLKQMVDQAPIQFPKRIVITRECKRLLGQLLQKDHRKRIEWTDFFEYEWFEKEIALPPISSMARPQGLPASTAPVPIQQPQTPLAQKGVRLNIVNNYMERLSSAPVGSRVFSPPIRNNSMSVTPSDQDTIASSMFVPATTPYGGSDPFGSMPIGGAGAENSQSSDNIFLCGPQSQSVPAKPTRTTSLPPKGGLASSVSQSLSDIFKTGYSLIQDSFQHGY